MGNAGVIKIAVLICLRLLTGEKSADMEVNFGMFEAELTAKSESEELLDAFLADEFRQLMTRKKALSGLLTGWGLMKADMIILSIPLENGWIWIMTAKTNRL